MGKEEMKIAQEIEQLVKAGTHPEIAIEGISEALNRFLCDWLEGGKSEFDAQAIWNYLIGACPAKDAPDCLFRGCSVLCDGKIESYSPKHDVATKFAGRKGYLIIMDSETSFVPKKVFDLTEFLSNLHEKLVETGGYGMLIDFMEMWGYEHEYLMRTDLDNSCVYQGVSKPEWIFEDEAYEEQEGN